MASAVKIESPLYVIKSGVLYAVADGAEREFQSPFAEEFYQEDSQAWERKSWKYSQSDNEPENVQRLLPRNMLWGGRGQAKPPDRVTFSAVFAAHGRLYYVLEMSKSHGLFYYDSEHDQEIRLFHRTDFNPRGLYICEDYSILTTRSNSDGTVHLALYDPNGKHEQMLTSGDCQDENPFRHGSAIYYQSSGLARNNEGHIVATGNVAIHKLDIKTGEIESVLGSEKFDYLLPRIAGDGTLYSIRVPHRTGSVYPIKNRLLDTLLFPWRLAVAIFAFLNAFSLFFAKKPLTTAGGPNPRQIDISQRILHNRVVNLQETWRQEGRKVAVSKEWKLIRHLNGESVEVASNVVWFDLDNDDHPVYTDGYALYDTSGKRKFEAEEMVTCLTLPRNRTNASAN